MGDEARLGVESRIVASVLFRKGVCGKSGFIRHGFLVKQALCHRTRRGQYPSQ
jgi:hypothetical protein